MILYTYTYTYTYTHIHILVCKNNYIHDHQIIGNTIFRAQALTIYALFGDDFRLCVTHKQTDELFNALTLVAWRTKQRAKGFDGLIWTDMVWFSNLERLFSGLFGRNASRRLYFLIAFADAKFSCLVFGAEIVANSLGLELNFQTARSLTSIAWYCRPFRDIWTAKIDLYKSLSRAAEAKKNIFLAGSSIRVSEWPGWWVDDCWLNTFYSCTATAPWRQGFFFWLDVGATVTLVFDLTWVRNWVKEGGHNMAWHPAALQPKRYAELIRRHAAFDALYCLYLRKTHP